ncbi:MAG: rRNA pseudouridine synthase [Candidatus Omnitrophica bacterium]|nr:rRNA pseudouridine synthase [Candidatus Omnitrophota bacterium]
MRLQVFLSHNGVCSRREAMDVIQAGRVRVNGCMVKEPSTPVDGSEDISVDGRKILSKDYTYILLHKPAGYTTTKDDPHAPKTVMDLLPGHLRHLSPVGRLDRDTEGLLLFTNDGAWAQKLTHPKFHLDKTYHVRIAGKLKPETKRHIEAGVMLEGRKTAPCRITDVRYNGSDTGLTITIHEGRKRQVRGMFYSVDHRVIYLKRIAVGRLTLENLKTGQWRELSLKEVENL